MLRLSPTRLTTYSACPQAYYLRYHRRIPTVPRRRSQLGVALHAALAEFYRLPGTAPAALSRLLTIWQHHGATVSESLRQRGENILTQFYAKQIEAIDAVYPPLGIEQRIKARWVLRGVPVEVRGQYDRLDWVNAAGSTAMLHLIDYKTGKPTALRHSDLQLGLYQLLLEQVYRGSLAQLSIIYLETGEQISYTPTAAQQQLVWERLDALTHDIVQERHFEPQVGEQCQTCSAKPFCRAFHQPEFDAFPECGFEDIQMSLF